MIRRLTRTITFFFLTVTSASAEGVTLACQAEDLPDIVMHYPSDENGAATMTVGNRPAAELVSGQGNARTETAIVDGYRFVFLPARMLVTVTAPDGAELSRNATCTRIGGPEEASPLDLSEIFPETTGAPTTTDTGAWRTRTDTSQFDDSETVILTLDADEAVRNGFGTLSRPALIIRCLENTTSLYLHMDGYHMSDIQGYGIVDLRIDDSAAFEERMDASDSGGALGLWRAPRSISLAKQLIGHDRLAARATPYSENPVEMTFALSGLENAIRPLREACHW